MNRARSHSASPAPCAQRDVHYSHDYSFSKVPYRTPPNRPRSDALGMTPCTPLLSAVAKAWKGCPMRSASHLHNILFLLQLQACIADIVLILLGLLTMRSALACAMFFNIIRKTTPPNEEPDQKILLRPVIVNSTHTVRVSQVCFYPKERCDVHQRRQPEGCEPWDKSVPRMGPVV